MIFYEIITLKTLPFITDKISQNIQKYIEDSDIKARLLGAWYSDVGDLNKIYILRSFPSEKDMFNERQRIRLSNNPFNCSEYLVDINIDSYISLDFLPPIELGEFGPLYEIRTYHIKLNGLQPTIKIWENAIAKRIEYSRLSVAMYSIDGQTRFTHIWPYKSSAERDMVRAKVVSDNIWPPKNGPDWLTPKMKSTLVKPMSFSPLK